MIDLKRARLVAWTFAEIAHNQEYKSAGYHVITAETGYGLANTLRDLVDEVELLDSYRHTVHLIHDENQSLRAHIDVLKGGAWDVKQKRIEDLEARLEAMQNLKVQEAMQAAGGFFGPRSEMENHLLSENEQLRQKLIDNGIPVE